MRYYSSLLRKIVLIIGDIICLYLATSIAMALELGNKQTDKIAFHLEFLPILVIMMFFSWKKGKLQATVKTAAAEASDKSEAGKAAVLVGDN